MTKKKDDILRGTRTITYPNGEVVNIEDVSVKDDKGTIFRSISQSGDQIPDTTYVYYPTNEYYKNLYFPNYKRKNVVTYTVNNIPQISDFNPEYKLALIDMFNSTYNRLVQKPKKSSVKFEGGGRMIPKALNGWWKSGIPYNSDWTPQLYRDALIEKMREDEELRQRVFGIRYRLFDTWDSRGSVSEAIDAKALQNNYEKWKENGERVKGNQKSENTSGDTSEGTETPKPSTLANRGAWDFNKDGKIDINDVSAVLQHFNNPAVQLLWNGFEKKTGYNYSNDDLYGKATLQMFDFAKNHFDGTTEISQTPAAVETPAAASTETANTYVGKNNLYGVNYNDAKSLLNAYNQGNVGLKSYVDLDFGNNGTVTQSMYDLWNTDDFQTYYGKHKGDIQVLHTATPPTRSEIANTNYTNFMKINSKAGREALINLYMSRLDADGNTGDYDYTIDSNGDGVIDELDQSIWDIVFSRGKKRFNRGVIKAKDIKWAQEQLANQQHLLNSRPDPRTNVITAYLKSLGSNNTTPEITKVNEPVVDPDQKTIIGPDLTTGARIALNYGNYTTTEPDLSNNYDLASKVNTAWQDNNMDLKWKYANPADEELNLNKKIKFLNDNHISYKLGGTLVEKHKFSKFNRKQ